MVWVGQFSKMKKGMKTINDAVSDASEEGSEDSEGAGHADNGCIDFAYPLAASWSEVRVDALPEGAPLNFGLPDFTPAGRGYGRAHELDHVACLGTFSTFLSRYCIRYFHTCY